MILSFAGVVEERQPPDSFPGYDYENVMLIGGQNVIESIEENFGLVRIRQPIKVVLNGEIFTGELSAFVGTPTDIDDYAWNDGSPPALTIGDIDLYQRLRDMAGQTVTLLITDELKD